MKRHLWSTIVYVVRNQEHYLVRYWLLIFLLGGLPVVSAQIFNAPQPAPNQNLGGGSTAWSAICASSSFNDYWVNFTWNPPVVNASNEFVLELSNADGNFDNPIELDRVTDKNTSFDFYFQFTFPQNLGGEGFKMRVRGTSPAIIGPESGAFPMYFLDVNNGINIRPLGQENFGNGTVQACEGQGATLEVYNLQEAEVRTYNWYRNGTLLSEKGSTLQVLESGTYATELDYGSCAGSGNTLSNQIQVTLGTRFGVLINPPQKSALCPGELLSLQANTTNPALTYTWYKDNNPLTPPTVGGFSFEIDASQANFSGNYQVEVVGTGVCLERSPEQVISDAAEYVVNRNNPEKLLLLPENSALLEIETDAIGANIQWYRDNELLAGAQSTTLEVLYGQAGEYFARVSLTGDCDGVFKDSEITQVTLPAELQATIGYVGNYVSCEVTNATLGIIQVMALDTAGIAYEVTSDLKDLIAWEWYQQSSLYSDIAGPELMVFNSFDSGDFKVTGQIDNYLIESNILPVQLSSGEDVVLEASAYNFCDPVGAITLQVGQDIAGSEYTWFFEGQVLNASEGQIQVTEPGTYEVWRYRGECPAFSNQITLTRTTPNLINIEPSTTFELFQGNTQVFTATGGESYLWLDAENNPLGVDAAFSVSAPGTYRVIATINGCEVSKTITVNAVESVQIPNVVSANGDGVNDLWIIPGMYSGQSEVKITIYNAIGQAVFQTYNYQNNWPSSGLGIAGRSEVFYYKISEQDKTIRQGTITVIR